MKIRLKNYTSWLAIIIATLITGYFVLLITGWGTSYSMQTDVVSGITLPAEDTAFGGIFKMNNLNDSLPYYLYKKQEDSLAETRRKRDLINESSWIAEGGRGFGYLGLAALPLDGIPYPEVPETAELKIKTNIYYLTLEGFTLYYDTKFFIANKMYNLAYPKWDVKDSAKKNGHYERKQIAVRYNSKDKKIMIPISKKLFDFINTSLAILPFFFIFASIYLFIGLPIQVIINISKGRAFIPKNILYLRLVSFALLIIVLLSISLPYLINYIFRAEIPSDFKFRENTFNYPTSYLSQILMGVGLFIVSIAFQKGYRLQQEQELTI